MTSVQLPGEDELGPQWVGEPTLLYDLCSATCLISGQLLYELCSATCMTFVQLTIWPLLSFLETSVQLPGEDEPGPHWGGEPTLLCDLCSATCLTSVQLPVWPLFSYLYDLCSATWRGWAWPQVRWRADPPVWPLFSYLYDLCSATCLTSVQLPVWPLFSYLYDLCSAPCLTSVQLFVWPLSATCRPLFSYQARMSLAPSEVESPPSCVTTVQLPVDLCLANTLNALNVASCGSLFQQSVWPLFSYCTWMTYILLHKWPLFSYLYDLCSATCMTSVQLPGEDEPGPQWGGEPTLLCDLCSATCLTSVQLPVWPLFSYLERMSLAPS